MLVCTVQISNGSALCTLHCYSAVGQCCSARWRNGERLLLLLLCSVEIPTVCALCTVMSVLQCKAEKRWEPPHACSRVKRRLRKWLRALYTLCTVHCYSAVCQWCSAKRRRVRASLMSRHFSSIMERQGGRTKIVDELESNLRAKLHMDGLMKYKTTKTWIG